jgi:recombination protein RecT
VYQGDDFEYELGLRRNIHHKRTATSDRDRVTHAYAVAKYRDGGFDFRVLDRLELDARRNRSRSSGDGPWTTDYDAMARKTVVRALSAYLPLTVEAASAVESDERVYDFSDLGDIIDADSDEVEPEPAA